MIGRKTHSPVPPRHLYQSPIISRTLTLFFGVWALAGMLAGPSMADEDVPVNAPRFSMQSLDGGELTLSHYQGQYLLINFWATWCGPCKVEMPSLEKLHRRFKDRNLTVLAVSNDIFGAQVVEPYIRGQNFTFTVGLDPKLKTSNQFGVVSLPTTFLIDPHGKIIGVLNGAENWSDPNTLLYFDQLLAKSVPAAETHPTSPCQKDQSQPC